MRLDAVEQPERGGVEQLGMRAAFHQPPGGLPLCERGRVVEWGAARDDSAVGLDVRAGVQQRVEGLDVVAGGGPMQRGFGVRAGEPGVDVRAASTSAWMVAATLG